jgi:hypothetical protein
MGGDLSDSESSDSTPRPSSTFRRLLDILDMKRMVRPRLRPARTHSGPFRLPNILEPCGNGLPSRGTVSSTDSCLGRLSWRSSSR